MINVILLGTVTAVALFLNKSLQEFLCKKLPNLLAVFNLQHLSVSPLQLWVKKKHSFFLEFAANLLFQVMQYFFFLVCCRTLSITICCPIGRSIGPSLVRRPNGHHGIAPGRPNNQHSKANEQAKGHGHTLTESERYVGLATLTQHHGTTIIKEVILIMNLSVVHLCTTIMNQQSKHNKSSTKEQ